MAMEGGEQEEACLDDYIEIDWSIGSDWSWDLDLLENSVEGGIRSEGGCIDRDHPGRLSPVFTIRKDSSGMVVIRGISSSGQNVSTPIERLVGASDSIIQAARCCGAACATRAQDGITTPLASLFTVVPVSLHQVMSADHCRFITYGSLATEFSMTLDSGVNSPPWKMDELCTFAELQKPSIQHVRNDDNVMVDPTHGSPYYNYETPVDFNFWTLASSGSAGSKKKGKVLTTFERFMFPASLTFFKTSTLAIIMYPDVKGALRTLFDCKRKQEDFKLALSENDIPTINRLKNYITGVYTATWKNHGGLVLADVKSSNFVGTEAEIVQGKKKRKEELLRKIFGLFESTWKAKTGDCMVGAGRLIGYNRLSIAHTVSTLAGASGSALVPTGGVGSFERVFVGIHLGPAAAGCVPLFDDNVLRVWNPDHNVALNCDHPDFVTQYWRNVVNDLPPPSIFSGQQQINTLPPFYHWIGIHLRLIVSSVEEGQWSTIQKQWLLKGVTYWLAECDPKEDYESLLKMLLKSRNMLEHLRQIGFPEGSSNQLNFIYSLRKTTLSLDLKEWNMPGVVCVNITNAAQIAASLCTDLLAEDQQYLKVPFQQVGKLRLVQYGIEVLESCKEEVLVQAIGWGFRSLLICGLSAEEALGGALVSSTCKRENVQILMRGWTSVENLMQSIKTMKCEYVDVVFVTLEELRAQAPDLKILVDSAMVKYLGLRTDLVEDVAQALELFPTLGVVQVNVSGGIIPVDVVRKCSEFNLGLVSTSDLYELEQHKDDIASGVTLAQLNATWKKKNQLLPFTTVGSREDLSELHDVAIQWPRFNIIL